MTRAEMDKLNVGDKVEVKIYNTTTEENEWIPVIVSRVLVCSDGENLLMVVIIQYQQK